MYRLALSMAVTGAGIPAAACTIALPYIPLSAIPAGAERTMLVDVVRVKFGHTGPVARLRVVRPVRGGPAANAVVDLRYVRSPCGEQREPRERERLVVYISKFRAPGWATVDEARRFDPAVR